MRSSKSPSIIVHITMKSEQADRTEINIRLIDQDVFDVHVVDVADDVDMELARELRRADNGGRDVVVQEEDVLAPSLREEEKQKGRREGESWKEKKVRRKQRNKEEVERIRRKEVTAEEVFLERMQRSVAGADRRVADEARRAERRMRRKAVWVERKREVRVAAAKRKREVAREGGPTRW
jgi:hypothetical protein